ncbi:Hypothetical_protein [Hexamita inflata]|uniref:Hypothetical_protein n=1 Tax=Hexamita inflata TaxID=28002 RepID=A0AA86UNQ5_9EUKA|nr:Hypothetical protein HINF_LOCUS49829 [Hexamita inflata]
MNFRDSVQPLEVKYKQCHEDIIQYFKKESSANDQLLKLTTSIDKLKQNNFFSSQFEQFRLQLLEIVDVHSQQKDLVVQIASQFELMNDFREYSKAHAHAALSKNGEQFLYDNAQILTGNMQKSLSNSLLLYSTLLQQRADKYAQISQQLKTQAIILDAQDSNLHCDPFFTSESIQRQPQFKTQLKGAEPIQLSEPIYQRQIQFIDSQEETSSPINQQKQQIRQKYITHINQPNIPLNGEQIKTNSLPIKVNQTSPIENELNQKEFQKSPQFPWKQNMYAHSTIGLNYARIIPNNSQNNTLNENSFNQTQDSKKQPNTKIEHIFNKSQSNIENLKDLIQKQSAPTSNYDKYKYLLDQEYQEPSSLLEENKIITQNIHKSAEELRNLLQSYQEVIK